MALADLFTPETKTELNFVQLHGLTAEAVKSDLLMNEIKCDVPHAFLREVMTGKKEEPKRTLPLLKEQLEDAEQKGDFEQWQKEMKSAFMQWWERQRAAGQQAPEEAAPEAGDVIMYAWKRNALNWADIRKYIQEDRAEKILTRGAEIHFALKDGRPAKAIVVGIGHYKSKDAVFRIVEPLTFAGMNKEHTNAGGWNKCEARRLLNEDIFPLLPDELQAVIAKHTTTQKIDGETVTSKDFLFLPSEFEIMGRNRYAEYNGLDRVFGYLKERINRLIVDEDDDLRAFWTADPSAAYATYFCIFDGSGGSAYGGAACDLALAPLFVIE